MSDSSGPPVVLTRRGFCLHADYALLSLKTGRVHFISHRYHAMASCGAGCRSAPIDSCLVRDAQISCLRCLTIQLLRLNRDGQLPTRLREVRP